MYTAAISGFQLSLGLIMAIGAQNAFVLRQGVRREHVLACVLFCAVSDAILISLGVAGFAAASTALPWLGAVLRWGGVAFLIVYGARRLFRVYRRGRLAGRPSGGIALGAGNDGSGRDHMAEPPRLSGHCCADRLGRGPVSGAGDEFCRRRCYGVIRVFRSPWVRRARAGTGVCAPTGVALARRRCGSRDVDNCRASGLWLRGCAWGADQVMSGHDRPG